MFGESDSESPRVGSPWDSFIAGSGSPASPPSPSACAELEVKTRLGEGLPKLVPEVEYGNVEYKLKLLNPSPERFTRLVTQMKWRLLEGGGQAYYELGVADSGQLIGLPRADLERSLETLEMMAGDIGASVIIVKEIEVPAALVGHGMNVALGIPQRTPVPATALNDYTSTTTETETETSTTEDDDDSDPRLGPDTPPNDTEPHITTTPDHDALFHPDFEIEIASVYKPRPHRSRPAQTAQSRYTKRGTHPKPKHTPTPSPKPKRQQQARETAADLALRAEEKRVKRDARRDARRRALLMPDVDYAGGGMDDVGRDEMATALRDLHVGLDPAVVEPLPVIPLLADLDLYGSAADADADTDESTDADAPEPRLIVEALVVRKLALEEAFLDFGGFALEI